MTDPSPVHTNGSVGYFSSSPQKVLVTQSRTPTMATTPGEQYRNADFIHGCIARLLAGQIAEAIKAKP